MPTAPQVLRTAAVRERIHEFLGVDGRTEGAAIAIRSSDRPSPSPISELARILAAEGDLPEIDRSLWDQGRIIADLDVEYVNHDFPGEPFLDPQRSFALQRPVVAAIQEVLAESGIFPLHLISGRGHHFLWSVEVGSEAAARLEEAGAPWAGAHEPDHGPPGRFIAPKSVEQAFVGLGMILEGLAHRVIEESRDRVPISVQITDVRVGSGERGRECISIDLSEYGDPLQTRYVHVPYTPYRKPSRRPDVFGDHVAEQTPELITIPLFEMSDFEGLSVMRDPARAAELAKRASVKIPDANLGVTRLAEAYFKSPLAEFHRRYYGEPCSAEQPDWTATPMPMCAARMLDHPNDLLLQPGGIQHVLRVLLALGWKPRNVGRVIQAKFEEDHGWGERWQIYDPARRADFYTRMFAASIVCGCDSLVDFNSVSHIEKGYCGKEECQCDLTVYQNSLRERVRHERVGSRPFNGLFSVPEHL